MDLGERSKKRALASLDQVSGEELAVLLAPIHSVGCVIGVHEWHHRDCDLAFRTHQLRDRTRPLRRSGHGQVPRNQHLPQARRGPTTPLRPANSSPQGGAPPCATGTARRSWTERDRSAVVRCNISRCLQRARDTGGPFYSVSWRRTYLARLWR
jgi:hypothetical protein